MAVQIPEVQRNQDPVAPQQTTPLDFKPVNTAQQFADTSAKLQQTGEAIKDTFDKAQQDGAVVAATNAANNLAGQMKGQLKGLLAWKGDPSQVYNDFHSKTQEFQDGILGQFKDAPEITQKMVAQRLSEARSRVNELALRQQAIQQTAYANSVKDTAVTNAKDDLVGSMQDYNPTKDPASAARVDVNVDAVRQRILEWGRQSTVGYAQLSDDGKGYKYISPTLELMIKKEQSGGLRSAIENLNNSGFPDRGKILFDKYKQMGAFTPEDENALLKHTKDAGNDHEALQLLNDVRTKGLINNPQALNSYLDKNSSSLEVAEKARANVASFQHMQDENEKRQTKDVSREVMSYLNSDAASGIHDMNDFMNDKYIKAFADKVDPSVLRKAYMAKFQPKTSDPTVFAKMMDMKVNGDLAKVGDYEELQVKMSGLSEKDQNFFKKAYDKTHDPSQGQSISQFKFLHEQLRNQLVTAGAITPDRFGKFSVSDQIKLNEYDRKMGSALDGNIIGKSSKDMQDFVGKIVSGETITKATTPKAPDKFNASPTSSSASKAPVSEGEAALGLKNANADLDKLRVQWSKENGGKRFGPNDKIADLLEIYNRNNKAK